VCNVEEYLWSQATSWKLEEAIQLFYIGNEGVVASSSYLPPEENAAPLADQSSRYNHRANPFRPCLVRTVEMKWNQELES